MRQTQAIPCEGYDKAFAAWSQANGFVSEWKLPPTAGPARPPLQATAAGN